VDVPGVSLKGLHPYETVKNRHFAFRKSRSLKPPKLGGALRPLFSAEAGKGYPKTRAST
jgi:hypothetical protein